MEYCDEIWHTHWYWQDLVQGTSTHTGICHLSLVEVLSRFKFGKKGETCPAEIQILKKVNLPYLLNLLEYFNKICIPIYIDKIYTSSHLSAHVANCLLLKNQKSTKILMVHAKKYTSELMLHTKIWCFWSRM